MKTTRGRCAQFGNDFRATGRPHDAGAADNYVATTTIWTGVNAVLFKDYSAANYYPQFASE